MKCQKCGQNEVNVYHSYNINGAVAETHLCLQCATGEGYDIMSMFSFKSMFEELLPMVGAGRYVLPTAQKVIVNKPALSAKCECGKHTAEDIVNKADAQMKELRELNMQMRQAVEKEEFEIAAILRDKIKELRQ